jgi:PmbA protein
MNPQFSDQDLEAFALHMVDAARKAGADEADLYLQMGRESEVAVRMGKIETLKESISQGFGLRVFKDKKLGFFYSSDFSPGAVETAIEQAISLVGETSADEHNGLPRPMPGNYPGDLDIFDVTLAEIPTRTKIDICLETENAVFEYDKRIVNSEGTGFYDGENVVVIADTFGNCRSFPSSYCILTANPVAQEDGRLQANSWHSMKRHFKDLSPPRVVAAAAAERTVRMLGARVPPTADVPVVFDQVTGSALLSSLIGALDGDAVFKGASFLAQKLDDEVASNLVTIIDDGLISRGLASAPFDGEGLPTNRKEIIKSGRLTTFLYDTYSARKSGTKSTANARREYLSLPSIGPLNFYLQPGQYSPHEIIESTPNGLLLTNLMGFGANTVTGDYSLGGSGIWIENGQLAYPVEGITVAANMLDILKRIDMIGKDLEFLSPVASPTFRVARMTVSGA